MPQYDNKHLILPLNFLKSPNNLAEKQLVAISRKWNLSQCLRNNILREERKPLKIAEKIT